MRAPHPMIPTLFAAALAVCVSHCARADDPVPPRGQEQQQPDVATLIEQLADPRMLVRVAAERTLRQRGPAVLAELPDPATLRPPAADAVRRIRADLERAQAQAALEPARVTLRGEMPLVEALQAAGKQTGNAIDVSKLPDRLRNSRLTLEFEDLAFWEAIGRIEQQADVVATCDPHEDAVLLRAASDVEVRPLASTNDGPFRVLVVRVREQLDFVNPDRRLLRTVLEVQVEPRLRALFLHVADAQIHVTDVDVTDTDQADTDKSDPPAKPFAPLSPSAKREIPIDRPGPIRITHDSILPQGNLAPTLQAVDIAGRFEIELAAGEERFEFRHLDEEGRITRRHGGVSVTLESLTHDDEVVDLQLQLRYDADRPVFESHRSWVFHNDAWLTTGEDRRLEPTDFETLAEGEGGAKLRYRFAGVEGITTDTQLNYTAPTLFMRVPISFELQNVPANR